MEQFVELWFKAHIVEESWSLLALCFSFLTIPRFVRRADISIDLNWETRTFHSDHQISSFYSDDFIWSHSSIIIINRILCNFIFEVSPLKSVITFSTLRKLEWSLYFCNEVCTQHSVHPIFEPFWVGEGGGAGGRLLYFKHKTRPMYHRCIIEMGCTLADKQTMECFKMLWRCFFWGIHHIRDCSYFA